MNIFHKVARQGLKKNRTQTVVTIIGVMLSAAMITAIATFGVSLLDYMVRGAIQKTGRWHAGVLDADAEFAGALDKDPEVEGTAFFENMGYAGLEGGKNPDKPYLYIAGFTQDTYDTLAVNVLSGRLPQNSSEVLIPAHLAANGGVMLSEGDTLTLEVGKRCIDGRTLTQADSYQAGRETLEDTVVKTYTVVGVCRRPVFEPVIAPGYTLITAADGSSDSVSVFAALKHPTRVKTWLERAAAGHTAMLNDKVLQFMGASGEGWFNLMLYAVGGIVVAIVMIGSIFLIHNAFSISLNERMQQIGMLASVGATSRQLRSMVLFEGLCIGAAGIPLGILLGIGSMGLLLKLVGQNFGEILYSGVSLTLVISPAAILAAAGISLVTILISAYVPAKRAASTPVMECIRQTNEIKVEAKAVRIARWKRRLYGLEGTLALKNFKRNKKRYRSVVLSLVLSVVLFIATSAFVTYLKQASEMAIVFTTYDIGFISKQMEDYTLQALYDQMRTADGVTGGNYQQLCGYTTEVPADDLTDDYWNVVGDYAPEKTVPVTMAVQFFDEESFRALVESQNLPVEEYTGPDAKLLGVAVMPIDDNREHTVEDFNNIFKDAEQQLSLTPIMADGTSGEAREVTITFCKMTVPDVPPDDSVGGEDVPYYIQVAAPWSMKETLAAGARIYAKGMTFTSDTAAQTVAQMETIIDMMGLTTAHALYNMHDLMADSRNYIFIANVFAYTFIVMISLIAVANVFNTISTNIRLRRRELAMLRSVGMADPSFNKMMRFECAFYGMQALAVGLPLALACDVLVFEGMKAARFDGVTFEMPWISMAISVGSVLLVVFTTMMYAVSKIRKENIIDTLRDDMA